METNATGNQSLDRLNLLLEYLSPILTSHKFRYEAGDSSHSSGGQFANGSFVHDKIKIGLIYRRESLGSVNYEGRNRNLSHDEMFKALGKEAEQKLLYSKDKFNSYNADGGSVERALLLDLEKVILPYIESAHTDDINSMMNLQPKWWEITNRTV